MVQNSKKKLGIILEKLSGANKKAIKIYQKKFLRKKF